MKRMLSAIWVLAVCALSCAGQTNSSTSTPLGFSLPALRLRAELQVEAEKAASIPTISVSTPATTPIQTVALESSLSDTEFHSGVIRSGEFYLVRAEPPSDSGVVRFVENIFTPEVVHLGKVPVSCSIVTAIKRKNPLCLLNPYFFQAWW
jgi:hypothetical protein